MIWQNDRIEEAVFDLSLAVAAAVGAPLLSALDRVDAAKSELKAAISEYSTWSTSHALSEADKHACRMPCGECEGCRRESGEH